MNAMTNAAPANVSASSPNGTATAEPEQQSTDGWSDDVVHREFGGPESSGRAFEVVAVDGRRNHRHARGVDHGFGGCEQRRHDEQHADRHLVDQDHADQSGHHDRPGDVEAHPQQSPVVPVGPRPARQDEEQPRQALGHGHPGDQDRIGRDRRRQQWQRDQPQAVAQVGQGAGAPQQPEVAREARTEAGRRSETSAGTGSVTGHGSSLRPAHGVYTPNTSRRASLISPSVASARSASLML